MRPRTTSGATCRSVRCGAGNRLQPHRLPDAGRAVVPDGVGLLGASPACRAAGTVVRASPRLAPRRPGRRRRGTGRGDVEGERRVAALVLADAVAVDPDGGAVVDGAEMRAGCGRRRRPAAPRHDAAVPDDGVVAGLVDARERRLRRERARRSRGRRPPPGRTTTPRAPRPRRRGRTPTDRRARSTRRGRTADGGGGARRAGLHRAASRAGRPPRLRHQATPVRRSPGRPGQWRETLARALLAVVAAHVHIVRDARQPAPRSTRWAP